MAPAPVFVSAYALICWYLLRGASPAAVWLASLWQRAQQGQLFGQAGLPPGVELDEQLLQENAVAVAAGEIPTAAQHQSLVQSLLEAVVPLLDVAVLVTLTGLDRLRDGVRNAKQGAT